jgi:hypothetical protein
MQADVIRGRRITAGWTFLNIVTGNMELAFQNSTVMIWNAICQSLCSLPSRTRGTNLPFSVHANFSVAIIALVLPLQKRGPLPARRAALGSRSSCVRLRIPRCGTKESTVKNTNLLASTASTNTTTEGRSDRVATT